MYKFQDPKESILFQMIASFFTIFFIVFSEIQGFVQGLG
jgi:hypothetical protein